MTKSAQTQDLQTEEAIERLIANAEPRSKPSPDVIAAAKLAVREEWQKSIRSQRRGRWFAMAASLAVVSVIALQFLPLPEQPIEQLATVSRIDGSVNLLGDNGLLLPITSENALNDGHTLKTEYDSSVGVVLSHGGSLRLDEKTEVVFLSKNEVQLVSGRIYYDSNNGASLSHSLRIVTAHGVVEHLGTQFMTDVRQDDILRVSVREGIVSIGGNYHHTIAESGRQVELRADLPPDVRRISGHGPDWDWVTTVAPAFDTEGLSFYEVLEWVAKETGLVISYADEHAKQVAMTTAMKGIPVESKNPLTVLPRAALTANLVYERKDGAIIVRMP